MAGKVVSGRQIEAVSCTLFCGRLAPGRAALRMKREGSKEVSA